MNGTCYDYRDHPEYVDVLQVLCANCNSIKRYENHELKRSGVDTLGSMYGVVRRWEDNLEMHLECRGLNTTDGCRYHFFCWMIFTMFCLR